MKTAIFYFTGTGNSLALAQNLQKRLKNADLLPLAGLTKTFDTSAYEKIIFLFPVYGGGIPAIVIQKLSKIKILASAYIGAICNYAGGKGAALSIFAEEFEKQTGNKIDAGWGLMMPGNYIPLYGAEPDEKIKQILAKANENLKQIAGEIDSKIKRPIERPLLYSLIKMVWQGFLLSSRGTGNRFRADESCTGCGLCARICPVDNISLNDKGKPEWHNKCLQCMACLQYCPEKAIHCFWWTKNRKRYHHPSINSQQIIAQKPGT
jgi:ferredoxin